MKIYTKTRSFAAAFMLALTSVVSLQVGAAVDGITGPTFNLEAGSASIATPDGDSVQIWGYGVGGVPQYPGPTLIVNQGDVVTINLTNTLTMPVSMVFPGQTGVAAAGGNCLDAGVDCLMTTETTTTATTYTFTADHAGTYMYHSGTNPELQTEMGLFGAIIVRPTTATQAYDNAATAYDHEYLFLLSEMDPRIHYQAEFYEGNSDLAGLNNIDFSDYKANLWFMNGRNGPDTFAPSGVEAPWLPNQPYNAIPRTTPGDTVLVRVIGASHHLHPLHLHGNNVTIIARDGRMLESVPGTSGPDLGRSDFTVKTASFQTYDGLWDWTGKGLGWDIYGHTATDGSTCVDAVPPFDGFDDTTREWCEDHAKEIPVVLPELQDLTFGGFYSGSPYLGDLAGLPPGEGGLNINGGLFFMWHSHTENELVNNDIFPGGMMTMMVIEPPGCDVTLADCGFVP